MLSISSFNALLKTLEEPPPHVKFVLATTDPQKIPVTILSRCLRFNLRRLLPEQIGDYLKLIVESEKIETEPEALVSISRAADGSMRDGLSLLDQAIAFGGGKLAMSDVENMLGLVDHEHVATMIRALAGGDAEALLAVVQELVSQSRDLETVLLNLAEVLHRVTLVQCVPGYRDPERSDWAAISDLAQMLSAEDAQLFYQIAIKGRNELGLAPDPRTWLEMTLLRMLAFRPASADSAGSTTGSGPLKAMKPAVVKKEPTARSKPAAAKPAVEPAPKEPREPELFSSPCSMPPVEAAESGRAEDDDWVALQGNLDITGQARELARNVQLQARSEDRWDFVIAPSLRHLGSETCVNRLGQAISEKMGHPVRIKLVDSEGQDIVTAAALGHQRRPHCEGLERATGRTHC